MCLECEENINWNKKFYLRCGSPCPSMASYCLNCQRHKRQFNLARAPLVYSESVARAIQAFKYEGKRYLALPFAKLLNQEFDKSFREDIKIDLITYVPLFKSKQKKRGYNQSKLLAIELSKLVELPLSKDNLIRIKDTATQTNLTYKERQKNLDGAFLAKDPSQFKNRNILLMDDVLTTGSTAEHCAKILKKAKAKEVYVLTIAIPDVESSHK